MLPRRRRSSSDGHSDVGQDQTSFGRRHAAAPTMSETWSDRRPVEHHHQLSGSDCRLVAADQQVFNQIEVWKAMTKLIVSFLR